MKYLSFALVALAASSLSAETPVENAAESEMPSLLSIYKDLHSHPELSTREERSSATMAKELRAAGCEVTDHFGRYPDSNAKPYGVVGIMKNGDGPTVLVRTDMDGLPVEEETGLPYASKVTTQGLDGREVHVMHACGHDVHMAAFVGVARTMQRLKDQWSGTIMFIGQPAEEAVGGAKSMLSAGLYNRFGKPNYALGFHDKAELATGHVGVTEGYTYANVDSIDMTVRGVGGHGAYPYKTKDPIMLSAEIINALQTIASRENNPMDPIVITVGSIHGGTKHNIIPDEVKMQLTVRTYKAEVRERVLAAIERVAKGCATAAGLPADRMPIVTVLKDQMTPATYNNPDLTKRLVGAWKKGLGDDKVDLVDATMGGEDFRSSVYPITRCRQSTSTLARLTPRKSQTVRKAARPCRLCIRVSSRPSPSRPSARPSSRWTWRYWIC